MSSPLDDTARARLLQEALDAFDDSVSIYENDGSHVLSSRSARRRFATFFEGLEKGLDHWDALRYATEKRSPHLSAERVESYVRWMRDRFHSGETYPIVTDDGREVQITYRPLSGGRRAGISVDVTELKERKRALARAHEAAEAASAAKSAFLASMSHEIRTPLNGVLGLASSLLQETLTPSQRSKVELMLESGRSLLELLNDVLDLSKIEAGRVAIRPVDVDVRRELTRSVELFRGRADEKALALTLACDTDLPERLRFDPIRMRQCLQNLVSNAVKFTDQGHISITAGVEGEGRRALCVRVADTGCGIADHHRDQLFDDFYQAAPSEQRAAGTGLGLAISRRLARQMGGDITFESEPGKGSVFSLTIAVEPAREADPVGATASSAEGDTPIGAVRVLLVDDHPINRKVAQLFLEPFDVEVIEARDGSEALDLLSRMSFDVVLLDLNMPVVDGREAVRRIRESGMPWADVPVVALTADASDIKESDPILRYIQAAVSKPVDQRELLSGIALALDVGSRQGTSQHRRSDLRTGGPKDGAV